MNERIKELIHRIAEQAQGTKKHVPAVWQFYDHELEKFAELIVRECAEVAKETRWAVPPSQEQIARGIKQHFGVEE